jgi:hypothetical protein
MADEVGKVDFTFGWLAMKLLGKSLYSNTWSALSELVANGFDAGAEEVYIFIDKRNKNESIIEIFDNGKGMTDEEIHTYVKVGYNKREDPNFKEKMKTLKPMGRKGIGKLAALYLSSNYYILTKTEDGSSSKWQMTYTELEGHEDEKPFLKSMQDNITLSCNKKWNEFKTGTFLRLTDVNLDGKGSVAFDSLEHKLSNYFSLNNTNRKIKLCIYDGKSIVFKDIVKSIAFKNMAYIEHYKDDKMSLEDKYQEVSTSTLEIPYTKKFKDGEEKYQHSIEISNFKEEGIPLRGKVLLETIDGEEKEMPYTLKGWIGIHSSIKQSIAKNNDDNFRKNTHYNPNQLRLYVRGKLAIENFLNIVDNTQAFVNYIEGEISFDILDDDNLQDIATSNRQSMDEHDPRIELLKDLLKPIIDDLIDKRHKLADAIKLKEKTLQDTLDNNAKKQFSKEVDLEIKSFGDKVPKEIQSELSTVIVNKVQGDVKLKEDRLVFLSHMSKDSNYTNFIYELLLSKGAKESEFFYTSRNGKKQDPSNTKALKDIIKKSIVNTNNLIFYLTSKNYKDSEFCMFEGGAGWATRAVGEYLLWTLNYDDIPKFLTNGRSETVIDKSLNELNYNAIIITLNTIINHINDGRRIKGEDEIKLFDEVDFPNKVELAKESKTVEDYMDSDILEYWTTYIK